MNDRLLLISGSGQGHSNLLRVRVNTRIYLTEDHGWTTDPALAKLTTDSVIEPGLYELEYIFINKEGDVGFNYVNDKYHPEFVGKDIVGLTKAGHLSFNFE